MKRGNKRSQPNWRQFLELVMDSGMLSIKSSSNCRQLLWADADSR